MKLTKLKKPSDILLEFLLGAAALATVVAAMWLSYILYGWLGKWIVTVPVAGVLSWVIGHLIFSLDPNDRHSCKGCKYIYTNVFQEWWHKRKCLPIIVKGVGR